MKTDRELLEAAAKAAGYPPPMPMHGLGGLNFGFGWWNPLVNPGEAFELAVQLRISIRLYDDEAAAGGCHEPYGADHFAATRRAIVRAAAEKVAPHELGAA